MEIVEVKKHYSIKPGSLLEFLIWSVILKTCLTCNSGKACFKNIVYQSLEPTTLLCENLIPCLDDLPITYQCKT